MLLRFIVPFVALLSVGCALDSRSTTAPSDAVIEVALADPLVAVNSTTSVTVRVRRLDGSPVEDGTEVELAASAGSLDRQTVQTTDGVATVSYQAGPIPGEARLSAHAGATTVEVAVTVVAGADSGASEPPRGVQSPLGSEAGAEVTDPDGADGLIGVQTAPKLKITASATRIAPADTVTFTIEATSKDGKAAKGSLAVDFGDGRTTTRGKFRDRTDLTQTYLETGRYRVVAELVAGDGSIAKTSLVVLVQTTPALRLTLSASPSQPTVGDKVDFTVEADRIDGKRTAGKLSLDLGDGRTAKMGDFRARTTVTRTYQSTGTFTVTALLVSGDGTTATAELVLSVTAALTVTMSASPSKPVAESPVTFTVAATSSDGKKVVGALTMDYGDGGTETVDFTRREKTSHTYDEAGTYTVSASLAHEDGRVGEVSLVVEVAAGSGADEIDLSQVKWLHANVSKWEQTSTITSVSIGNPPVCISHTKSGKWPTITVGGVVVEGNPWIFVMIDGQWYAGTYEWNRPGQTCKGNIKTSTLGEHIKKPPLDSSWKGPKSGQKVGFMVTTPARFGPQGKVNERSNVVIVFWP